MLEVSAEDCGSQGRLPGGDGVERKCPPGKLEERIFLWSRPRNTGHGVAVGKPEEKEQSEVGGQSVKIPSARIQLLGVHTESH